MLKLETYIPKESLEVVKKALFEIGAGKLGNYDCCSYESEGVGQFRALKGATPFIGEVNQIERVNEVKLELVFEKKIVSKVIETLKKAHPYEVPAYQVFEVLDY